MHTGKHFVWCKTTFKVSKPFQGFFVAASGGKIVSGLFWTPYIVDITCLLQCPMGRTGRKTDVWSVPKIKKFNLKTKLNAGQNVIFIFPDLQIFVCIKSVKCLIARAKHLNLPGSISMMQKSTYDPRKANARNIKKLPGFVLKSQWMVLVELSSVNGELFHADYGFKMEHIKELVFLHILSVLERAPPGSDHPRGGAVQEGLYSAIWIKLWGWGG